MWYRIAVEYNSYGQLVRGNPKKVKFFAEEDDENIDVAQLPNVEDADDVVDEEIPIEEQPLVEVPTQVESEIETPKGVKNRKPIPITLPPGFKVPPVHEFCHCEIETFVSGRQVWKLGNGENHCQECVTNMQIFNAENERLYSRLN